MIHIVPMQKKHIDGVAAVEKNCFEEGWSKNSFKEELEKNNLALYYAAIDDDDNKIVGYGGMWHVVNEGHITNIAVLQQYRRKNIATEIIKRLEEEAKKRYMIGMTLEVRRSNFAARNLYTKMGFKIEGIRKEYYKSNKEDAIIMWKYFENAYI